MIFIYKYHKLHIVVPVGMSHLWGRRVMSLAGFLVYDHRTRHGVEAHHNRSRT